MSTLNQFEICMQGIPQNQFAESGFELISSMKNVLEVQMTNQLPVHYFSDADGNTVSVIVPIELWHEIESAREMTAFLHSDEMKRRLIAAHDQPEGISLEDARAKLGF